MHVLNYSRKKGHESHNSKIVIKGWLQPREEETPVMFLSFRKVKKRKPQRLTTPPGIRLKETTDLPQQRRRPSGLGSSNHSVSSAVHEVRRNYSRREAFHEKSRIWGEDVVRDMKRAAFQFKKARDDRKTERNDRLMAIALRSITATFQNAGGGGTLPPQLAMMSGGGGGGGFPFAIPAGAGGGGVLPAALGGTGAPPAGLAGLGGGGVLPPSLGGPVPAGPVKAPTPASLKPSLVKVPSLQESSTSTSMSNIADGEDDEEEEDSDEEGSDEESYDSDDSDEDSDDDSYDSEDDESDADSMWEAAMEEFSELLVT